LGSAVGLRLLIDFRLKVEFFNNIGAKQTNGEDF